MIKDILRIILPVGIIQLYKTLRIYSYRVRHGLKLINTKYNLIEIGEKGTDTYFGYYDISPFNINNELVYLEIPKGEKYANIVYNDILGNKKKNVTKTHAYNTQQGSRLRWYPCTDDTIVFNDFIDDKYVCRKMNIKTSEEIVIPYPIYDISSDGKFGLSLNFERLGVLRPGYGYTNKPYLPEKDLSSECISLIDMQSLQSTPIITYRDIADIMAEKGTNFSNNYINHLSFSPEGDKFIFFWLSNDNNYTQANLLLYDLLNRKLSVLEKELRVSHYTWINNDKLLCTAISRNPKKVLICNYYEYQLGKERKIVGQNVLQKDGHPSFYNDNIILSDTYPNIHSYQTLFFYNIKEESCSNIVYSYSVPVNDVEFRTDMHPRFNNDKTIICYDANVRGERRLYLIKNWNDAIN